jgi:hypothetical protein
MDGRGLRVQGQELAGVEDATTIRLRGGEVVIADGPFAETKELIAGFDILDCADLDEAIEHAGIPYRVPPMGPLPERTSGVLAVLYLMFNEGYPASTGKALMGRGLLALMLFQHSPREARTDPAGDVITL